MSAGTLLRSGRAACERPLTMSELTATPASHAPDTGLQVSPDAGPRLAPRARGAARGCSCLTGRGRPLRRNGRPQGTPSALAVARSTTGAGRRQRPRRALGLAAVVGGIALLLLPASGGNDQRTLLRSARGAVLSADSRVVAEPGASVAAGQAKRGPVARLSRPAAPSITPSVSPASSTTEPESAVRGGTAAIGAIREGDYVFGNGNFRVVHDGTSLIDFTLARCSGLVLPPMQIRADGTFTAHVAKLSGRSRSVGVDIEGRFVTPEVVRGELSVDLPDCTRTRSPFLARLNW